MKERTYAKKILELHMGSDFYKLKELECVENIVNSMIEFKNNNAATITNTGLDIPKSGIHKKQGQP